MKRISITFAGQEIEFVDREVAIRQIRQFAEEGTYPVYVIYGPEGCGKTAFLQQAKVILEEEFGYRVIYVNPLAEETEKVLQFTSSIEDIVREVFSLFPEPYSRIVDVAINVASRVLRKLGEVKLAVLMDDIFQAVGLDKAERYVKILLNLIEWPPRRYEKIVVLVTSSEGITKSRVGRHSWADLFTIWNMSREGFRELYEKLPGKKPDFESTWKLTGGNPRYLERLYRVKWNVDYIVNSIIQRSGITRTFVQRWKKHLEEAINDPDYLWYGPEEVEELAKELIEKNLIVFNIPPRKQYLWIDTPPPEKDLEIGVGKHVAWQTPLHREAIRRMLDLV